MKTYTINFMAARHWAGGASLLFSLLAVVGLFYPGLKLGLDFTGGALTEVAFAGPVPAETLRQVLQRAGIDATVQPLDTDRNFAVRLPALESVDVGSITTELASILPEAGAEPRIVNAEVIGPAVGAELRDSAGLAAIAAFIVVGIYIMFRFTKKFAVGALIALIHDVLITLGVFALFQWPFDLPAFAAVLAIIGYSLNDSIVVYDRIRENYRRMRKSEPIEVINRSLNQTWERTIVMSGTTLLSIIALAFFGGETVHSFALAMIIGIIVGTYSSAYVASVLVLAMGTTRMDLMPPDTSGSPAPP